MTNRIVRGDNLTVLRGLPDASAGLIYVDPPFNTGKTRTKPAVRSVRDENGTHVGFGGRRYRAEPVGGNAAAAIGYDDRFDDFLAFLRPRLVEARRVLRPDGAFFLHIGHREVHYCKVLLDGIFGRASFMNEIVWAYDYGARTKTRWPAKHDDILWYAADPGRYVFNYDAMDRLPYLAPNLVTPEKAARGKTPTDVWWNTIVSPTGKEKTGYPTQKPLAILERIVKVHSNPGDPCLDFFAGSGTLGEAAAKHGRPFLLVDDNPEAIRVMTTRLAAYEPEVVTVRSPRAARRKGADRRDG